MQKTHRRPAGAVKGGLWSLITTSVVGEKLFSARATDSLHCWLLAQQMEEAETPLRGIRQTPHQSSIEGSPLQWRPFSILDSCFTRHIKDLHGRVSQLDHKKHHPKILGCQVSQVHKILRFGSDRKKFYVFHRPVFAFEQEAHGRIDYKNILFLPNEDCSTRMDTTSSAFHRAPISWTTRRG